MSLATPDRLSLSNEVIMGAPIDLEIGQRVMVLQTLHELPEAGSDQLVGPFVREVTTIHGTIRSLPGEADELSAKFVTVDQGPGQPTALVPLRPVNSLDRAKGRKVLRLLAFDIQPVAETAA